MIPGGLFITFEGPEGSGKSTHSRRLCAELAADGYEVLHTAEPGGTPLGRKIRDILLEKDDIRLGREAELLLFEADRAQHVADVIVPALESGKVVVCDRFNTATAAYQGYGLGMDMGLIDTVDAIATGGLCPDLVILLDIDVGKGLARATSGRGGDRMEKRDLRFHEDVRKGYLAMAEKFPDRIKVIKVSGDIDRTYDLVRKEAYDLFARYKGAGQRR
ncbi:MAG: dTMP kinase [Candidatus Omnitrophota bacterium]